MGDGLDAPAVPPPPASPSGNEAAPVHATVVAITTWAPIGGCTTPTARYDVHTDNDIADISVVKLVPHWWTSDARIHWGTGLA